MSIKAKIGSVLVVWASTYMLYKFTVGTIFGGPGTLIVILVGIAATFTILED